jgi:Microtubule-associated protein 70
LEIKKLYDEKKASVAAQFAAEATLRRVHAAQKDDDMPPIEAILTPLEAELKVARQEVGYHCLFSIDFLSSITFSFDFYEGATISKEY